ncbi:MAG: hypothetical protein IJR85_07360 [Synergistaceae bacterium]|nr:hypothetical protein [Synergistaceae bacterium]
MKPKYLAKLFVMVLTCALTLGVSAKSDEVSRMGIFVSNFTEAGLYQFDLEEDGDPDLAHFGDPAFTDELIKFGITHNVINNPKSTIKTCRDKTCEYGKHIISGQSVAASVRKYFDLPLKNQSIEDSSQEVYYDGRNYHINAPDWRPETVYYAEVQEVSRRRGVITMSGELYNLRNKKDRPATFTATAKPHEWNGKDTWAILSLNVDWK